MKPKGSLLIIESGQVAELVVWALNASGRVIKGSKVLVMGLVCKENVPDACETPVREFIHELKGLGADLYGFDPLLTKIEEEFGIKAIYSKEFTELDRLDCVIWAVNHKEFNSIKLKNLKCRMSENPVLIDVRGHFEKNEVEKEGFYYYSLQLRSDFFTNL